MTPNTQQNSRELAAEKTSKILQAHIAYKPNGDNSFSCVVKTSHTALYDNFTTELQSLLERVEKVERIELAISGKGCYYSEEICVGCDSADKHRPNCVIAVLEQRDQLAKDNAPASIPAPTSVPVTASEALGNCPKCGSYLQRRLDGSIGCQPCDVRELTACPRPVCGTPTPPDLEKETDPQRYYMIRLTEFALNAVPIDLCLTFIGQPELYIRSAFQSLELNLSQLRAENERLKKALLAQAYFCETTTEPPCWCERRVNFPHLFKDHTSECVLARAALSGSAD